MANESTCSDLTPADYATAVRAGVFGKGYPITEFKYDAHGNTEYIGIAPRNTLTSQPSWIVEKLTYGLISSDLGGDPQYMVIRSRISPDNSVFDDYLTLQYL